METTREELQQKIEENEKQAVQLQHQNQRIENRIEYLKKRERQIRAHRLITCGAAIESIVPQVANYSEHDFYSLMEYIFEMPSVQTVLRSFHPLGDKM